MEELGALLDREQAVEDRLSLRLELGQLELLGVCLAIASSLLALLARTFLFFVRGLTAERGLLEAITTLVVT